MNNWQYAEAVPTSPWRGSMTLPRELSLATVDGVPRLLADHSRRGRHRIGGTPPGVHR